MRYSNLFAKTKRDAPSDITDPTLRLAYRAGMIRPAEHGQVTFLPLAANVISQMFLMLRGDLQELGAQELRGSSPIQLDLLASAEIQSYKQLPACVFWYGGGMTQLHLAALETNMQAGLETREKFIKLANDFFEYAGLAPKTAHEISDAQVWYAPEPQLDFEVFVASDYAATRAAASPSKVLPPWNPDGSAESPLPLQEIETPHSDTIQGLARLLNVPTSRTAKAVFYAAGDRVIFAVIRGDLQIDEAKMKRALKVNELRWASEDEIVRVGAVPGYASPIGIRGATIIVDDSIANSPNLVAGANKAGYHLLNTNVPRDYKPDVITDIALARVGDASPVGAGTLELVRGARLGSIAAPRELNANFLDVNGKAQKQIGVILDLDLGAILLAHLAAHHDDKGIIWSRAVAPYDVYIVALNADKPEVAPALAQVNDVLELAGLETFVDDRNESAGVKFNDADLLGLPLRITVGPKTVAQGGVEFKARDEATARLVTLDALGDEINRWIGL